METQKQNFINVNAVPDTKKDQTLDISVYRTTENPEFPLTLRVKYDGAAADDLQIRIRRVPPLLVTHKSGEEANTFGLKLDPAATGTAASCDFRIELYSTKSTGGAYPNENHVLAQTTITLNRDHFPSTPVDLSRSSIRPSQD